MIPTKFAKHSTILQSSVYDDGISNPMITGEGNLMHIIANALEILHRDYSSHSWGYNWIISPYSPTPTIIEAARSLYENHSVENITRHEADDVSTDRTINCILEVIRRSKTQGKKSVFSVNNPLRYCACLYPA